MQRGSCACTKVICLSSAVMDALGKKAQALKASFCFGLQVTAFVLHAKRQ